ncbi:hypothetical protein SK3146_05735 [Paenibacillus konkukensis]|uniref:ABC transporter ATP-binding protein n=1 Tax=Paenibacillus konkukensis TaxID=2020716 RepID=A0ABY4RVW5_9BACL|nr:hypothetical protein SK3146_05735 [Paenibacillus konkukensis]
MVTHNSELAEEYSDRIIRFLDGEIQSDNNSVIEAEVAEVSTQSSKTQKSEIAAAQKDSDKDVLLGIPFTDEKAKEEGIINA